MSDTLGETQRGEQVSQSCFQAFNSLRALADSMPAPQTLLGPFKTGQVGFLAAPAGVGKSMFALAVTGAITRSEGLGVWEAAPAGEQGVRLGKVIDAELTPADLVQRIRTLRMEASPIQYDHYTFRDICNREHFSLGNPVHQAYLMQNCERADVIVVDNVTFTLDPAEGHTLYSPETIAQMRPLFNWIRAAGKLLILVDHTNAQGQLAGSLHKHRLADWVALLEPDTLVGDLSIAFTLKFDKYRGEGRPKKDIAWKMTERGVWSAEYLQTLPDQIKELLRDGMSAKEVAEELGCSVRYVHKFRA